MALLLQILTFFSLLSLHQEEQSLDHFLESYYRGGARAFYQFVMENTNYPRRAMNHCTMGISKMKLTISKKGDEVQTEFVNKLGDGISEELVRVMELTKGNWILNSDIRQIEFYFEFRINEKPLLTENVLSVIARSSTQSVCASTTDLERELSDLLVKKKYKRARRVYDQLIKRNPYALFYQQAGKIIEANM